MAKARKILSVIMIIALISSALCFSASAGVIKLKIDGKIVDTDTAPVIENDRTLVPIRVISETLGAKVEWDGPKQQVTITSAAYTLIFTIGSKTFTSNGISKTLDAAPKIINDRTMVPLRAIAEAMGAKVSYDSANNIAVVDYFTTMTGSLKVSGSTTVFPIMQAAVDYLKGINSGLSITVDGGGSGAGIKATQEGANNVGMSSRELTADELKTLKAFEMGCDGIALIVHPNNPVTNLTKEQAAKIFLGEIKNWKDVGGNDAPILIQTRETGSGTLATLEELLLDKKSVVSTATPYTSSALIKQAVAKSENAIGFDSIGFVDSSVKTLSLNGVKASAATVQNNTYAMSRYLFVCTKGAPSGLSAMLIDFLRTDYSQKNFVAKEGYVALPA